MSKKKFSGHVFKKDDSDEDVSSYADEPVYQEAPVKHHSHSKKHWDKTPYVKCYEKHPVLALGGGTLIGGSCNYPVTLEADVYIGFDYGMKLMKIRPWAGDKNPIQVHFEVQDMHSPKDAVEYMELVKWTVAQLEAGKTVHAGCIGGHGRTGMFIAALYKLITGEEDAITKVREIYCTKAVESKAQVEFLHKHFGIKKAEPAKEEWVAPQSSYKGSGAANSKTWKSSGPQQLELSHMKKAAFSGSVKSWSAIRASEISLFGSIL